ncbi:MAG TPA: NlpC/P60 family protein [Blastocatellia bacterium]|nr:NlpC/P60 family protein [Blastocatellia bacterium]HMV87408.1 NlpC/P60 family protein [Blastocatellia bacterium]HMX28227.1 NlpC/P60 family protein [Blastocatellia bacterium]HMY73977.1 NlpC/P60 family protein [Blastocatellia bacterium]HMZ16643.1 NlpC/P60 family protein [Blastocatellia bacterium]
MKTATKLLPCLFSFVALLMTVSLNADAQVSIGSSDRPANENTAAQLPQLPQTGFENFTSLVFPAFRPTFNPGLLTPPLMFMDGTSSALFQAISKRLGVRYKFFGTDDNGYDCSGFVWRVFQDAGTNFDRVAARVLWKELPEAVGEETNQFGTLVFFNGLKHVGIVRDAFSFYHASRSQGVVLSTFAGYWGSRITGYRRSPALAVAEPANIGD